MAAQTRSDPASCEGLDEIEIVRRRVVFGKTPPHAPHQAAHGKIETRRAILPLVVTVRREFQNLGGFAAML